MRIVKYTQHFIGFYGDEITVNLSVLHWHIIVVETQVFFEEGKGPLAF